MLHEPYFSHNFCSDTHVLLGSTSRILPTKGTPRGWGIGVVIVMSYADQIDDQRLMYAQYTPERKVRVWFAAVAKGNKDKTVLSRSDLLGHSKILLD